jgi:hypothetical protein
MSSQIWLGVSLQLDDELYDFLQTIDQENYSSIGKPDLIEDSDGYLIEYEYYAGKANSTLDPNEVLDFCSEVSDYIQNLNDLLIENNLFDIFYDESIQIKII